LEVENQEEVAVAAVGEAVMTNLVVVDPQADRWCPKTWKAVEDC
jgi:hypothetical protein